MFGIGGGGDGAIHQGAELAIAHAIIKCYFCY